jgi:hypothetical protein
MAPEPIEVDEEHENKRGERQTNVRWLGKETGECGNR